MLSFSCTANMTISHNGNSLSPAIVYKTKADYNNNVSVTMDSKKGKIISYPAPTDLYYRGNLALPSKLKNGYLLDNRGINTNSVFTSFTYQEYSKLYSAPSIDTLLEKIIDKDPFVEIYNCGNRADYKNETKELNKIIDSNFKKCKRLK